MAIHLINITMEMKGEVSDAIFYLKIFVSLLHTIRISISLLLYKLEYFIGISTTEKNRISTHEKFRYFFMYV